MSPRWPVHSLRNAVALLLCLSLSAPLTAQDAAPRPDTTQPDVENSKFQISGVINANAVYVRSGPSENDYVTTKLDKGAAVTVVGERFNWLKVVPPPGSFCYVGKAFVNRAGNGTIGQVTSTLNVRIGSDQNQLKAKIATKLEPGQKVEIIGEQDEYFLIKPPADVYLYVSKQFVDPIKPVVQEDTKPPERTKPGDSTPENGLVETRTPTDRPAPPERPTEAPNITAGAPTTQASDPVADKTPEPPAATQPAVAALEAEFERLEARYGEITQKPLDEQPVDELLEGYKKLASSSDLPESLRRICDFKAGVLSHRIELKKDLLGARQIQEDMKQKQAALKGEQKDLEELVKRSQIQIYTAVGTLRTSTLQQGEQTLYRLTDPANSRSVVYLRTSDNRLGQYVGQFLGVRGDLEPESPLGMKIISVTGFENVNPTKVGQSVAAQFVPPSLLPGRNGNADINE
jgi:SH3-like domain-containing protein